MMPKKKSNFLYYTKTVTNTAAGHQYGHQSHFIWTNVLFPPNVNDKETNFIYVSYQGPNCRICLPCFKQIYMLCNNQYLRNLETTRTVSVNGSQTFWPKSHSHSSAFTPFSYVQLLLHSHCTYLLFPRWIVVLVHSEVGVCTVCVVIRPLQKVVG